MPLSEESVHASPTGHEDHCFVVMPFGKTPAQQKWFRGWYEVVIESTVLELGYVPKLASNEPDPVAINDEIRAHLAHDAMVIADLAGYTQDDEPNPNVMYELGIRHALGLPVVMMGWKDQRLPFDVGNQRAILEERALLDIEVNRRKLRAAIASAKEGRYYKPMDAIARSDLIRAATAALGEGSLLSALANEIKDLRATVAASAAITPGLRVRSPHYSIKTLLKKTPFYREIYEVFAQNGGSNHYWGRLMMTRLNSDEARRIEGWDRPQWRGFAIHRAVVATALALTEGVEVDAKNAEPLPPELLEQVKTRLPPQPWPVGIHRLLATELGEKPSRVYDSITELIRRGDVAPPDGPDSGVS